MRKQFPDPLAPKVYLPSKDHPDYQNQEWDYFVEHRGKKLLKKGRLRLPGGLGLDDPKVLAVVYSNVMANGKIGSVEIDDYVISAIKLFSENIIQLTESLTPFRLSDEANRLGGHVCRFLGSLISQAQSGNYEERKLANKRFSRIIKSISPDARGKKKVTASPFSIQLFYWGELFRLYHIENALKSSVRNLDQKLRAISTSFEMPIDQIREFWKVDENFQPIRPIRLKEMARILTARHFGITQHRVSNILSSRK
jgi:hypothetical protein